MTKGKLPDAIIYCRVSDPKQVKQGHGLASQETRCREFAETKGYNVIEVFHEEGVTGKLLERPQIQRMLSFLRRNKRSNQYVVIIDDISRLTRDIETHIQLRTSISATGAKLESPSIEFGESSDSRLVEHLLASVAAHQREKNAEQVRNRMRARAMSGYWVACPPIGYRFRKVDGHGKLLVRDEPVASLIQEGLEGFASGRFTTQMELKRFFDAQPSFPKAKNGEVHIQRVVELLTRPIYAARITLPKWGLRNVPAKHEGLISFETFQINQERMQEGARVYTRKDVNDDFPLRGFVCCEGCNKPMTACWSKGRKKLYGYYYCQRKGCEVRGKSFSKEKVEADFEALLDGIRPHKDLWIWEQRSLKNGGRTGVTWSTYKSKRWKIRSVNWTRKSASYLTGS